MSCVATTPTSMRVPFGYRFHPTDEELLLGYLKSKIHNLALPCDIIREVELYKYDPSELLDQCKAKDDEKCYFFTSTDRKYLNGKRPNRSTKNGYWKASAGLIPIKNKINNVVGHKRSLVFYNGKPPNGKKSKWIMYEYKLKDECQSDNEVQNNGDPMKLDKWTLCSIYENKSAVEKEKKKSTSNMASKELANLNMHDYKFNEYQSAQDGHNDDLDQYNAGLPDQFLGGSIPTLVDVSGQHNNQEYSNYEVPLKKCRRMEDIMFKEAILSQQAERPHAYGNMSNGEICINHPVDSLCDKPVEENNFHCFNNLLLRKELKFNEYQCAQDGLTEYNFDQDMVGLHDQPLEGSMAMHANVARNDHIKQEYPNYEFPRQKQRMENIVMKEAIVSQEALAPYACGSISNREIHMNQLVDWLFDNSPEDSTFDCSNNLLLHRELQRNDVVLQQVPQNNEIDKFKDNNQSTVSLCDKLVKEPTLGDSNVRSQREPDHPCFDPIKSSDFDPTSNFDFDFDFDLDFLLDGDF